VDAVAIHVADDSAYFSRKTTKQLFCSRKALVVIGAIMAIGTVALMSILLVSMRNRGSDDDNGTSYRENLGIRQEIAALLGGASYQEQLESPSSPYAKALEWMIHQDPMQLVPGDDSNFSSVTL
jgi:hypothetical protein